MKGYILLLSVMLMAGYGSSQTGNLKYFGDAPENLQNNGSRAWQILFEDDFEGTFPGSNWELFLGAGSPDAVWDTWSCWSVSGTKSAGCAAGGTEAITCNENYLDNMHTRMRHGPFDLSDPDITAAQFSFEFNLNCEIPNDGFQFGASINGTDFFWGGFTGTGINSHTYDLNSFIGQTNVWIAFEFLSNGSVNMANGVQVDDVEIKVDIPSGPQDINIFPSSLVYHEYLNNIPSNRDQSAEFSINDFDRERAIYQLFSEIPDISLLNSYQKEVLGIYASLPTTGEFMVVSADIGLLKREETFYLNLFDDETFRVVKTKREIRGNNDFSWFGMFPGYKHENAHLVVNGNSITGSIRVDGELYSIKPLGSGLQMLIRINEENFPDEHPAGYKVPVTGSIEDINMDDYSSGRMDDGSVVTVLVAYNALAASQVADIDALIQLAVDETNQSYVNSDIDPGMFLVHKYLTSYTQTTDLATDLTRFRVDGDGYMDEVHELREVYGADICLLIVGTGGGGCGVAAGQPANESIAFCVVRQQCATGYYSFGHEIGHLQGAGHNPETGDAPAFPYGHGYLYLPDAWRTIMSYDNLTPPPVCARIQYWSNPDILYNGDPMGTISIHDNARVLDETDVMVASFRHSDTMSFSIQNQGGAALTVSSIGDNRDWLTLAEYPSTPFVIPVISSQSVECQIDWTKVGSADDMATVTITSDDPDEDPVLVQVTVKPIPVPTNLNLENITIGSGETECYDATNIVTLGGSGTTFVVQSGADVTIIAGNIIYMKPGVTINSGADFHAFITTSGDYCGDAPRNLYLKNEVLEELVASEEENVMIRVYPNPTTGNLVVEVLGTEETYNGNIEVFDFTGRLLISELMKNAVRTSIDLNTFKKGIYFVKVQIGDKNEVTKVIKN